MQCIKMTKVSKSLAMTRNSCLTNVSGTCFSVLCFTQELLRAALPEHTEPSTKHLPATDTALGAFLGQPGPSGCSWPGYSPSLMPTWHSATVCDLGGTGEDVEHWVPAT